MAKSYRSDEIEPTNRKEEKDYKRGGQVPKGASPSGGKKTDDVKADLTAGEYVIPKRAAQNIGPGNIASAVSAAGGPTPRSITNSLYGGRQHLDTGGVVGGGGVTGYSGGDSGGGFGGVGGWGAANTGAPAGTSTVGGFSNGGVGNFGPASQGQGWGQNFGGGGVATGAPGTVGGTTTNTSNNSASDYGSGSTSSGGVSTGGPASRGGGYSAPSGGYGYGGGSTGYSASTASTGGTTGGSVGGYGFSGYGGAGGNAGGGWGYNPLQGSSYVSTSGVPNFGANVSGAAAYFGVPASSLTAMQLHQYMLSQAGSTATPAATTTPVASNWGTPGSTTGIYGQPTTSVASLLSSITPAQTSFETGTSSGTTRPGVSAPGSVVGNVGGTYGTISPTPGYMAGWRGGGY